jgi:hypothetical protein
MADDYLGVEMSLNYRPTPAPRCASSKSSHNMVTRILGYLDHQGGLKLR